MPSLKKLGLMTVTLLPLALTACGGEGWELRKTTTTFPYGNQRTAGSGVEWVRASMMPAKGPVIEAPAPTPEPAPVVLPEPQPAPAPVKPADPVFNNTLKK
ncbi:MAG TPA: hypothetical protein VGD95_07580 [Micavibrio sp.]